MKNLSIYLIFNLLIAFPFFYGCAEKDTDDLISSITITGKVVDKETGKAIADCEVKLNSEQFVRTKSDGSFSITNGEGKGSYTLTFSANGYAPREITKNVTNQSKLNFGTVQLEAAVVTLKGVVTDKESGNAIEGVRIQLDSEKFVTTGADGKFTLLTENLRESYAVSLYAVGYKNKIETRQASAQKEIDFGTIQIESSSTVSELKTIIINGKTVYILSADVGELMTSGQAKSSAEHLTAFGFSTWRLPNADELNQIYLKKDEIGGFYEDYYWSSDTYNGHCQHFGTGAQSKYQESGRARFVMDEPYISIDQQAIEVSQDGGYFDFTINSNTTGWAVYSDSPSWCLVDGDVAIIDSYTKTLRVSYPENLSGAERKATIHVGGLLATGPFEYSFVITQEAGFTEFVEEFNDNSNNWEEDTQFNWDIKVKDGFYYMKVTGDAAYGSAINIPGLDELSSTDDYEIEVRFTYKSIPSTKFEGMFGLVWDYEEIPSFAGDYVYVSKYTGSLKPYIEKTNIKTFNTVSNNDINVPLYDDGNTWNTLKVVKSGSYMQVVLNNSNQFSFSRRTLYNKVGFYVELGEYKIDYLKITKK